MGQKTNPTGFRLAVRRNWQSRWYATKKDFPKLLLEDQIIREKLMEKLKQASVPRIFIERASNRVRVKIYTARPGIVIGRKGQEIEKIKDELAKLTGKEILLDIQEVKKPEIEAQLVAENVALQLDPKAFVFSAPVVLVVLTSPVVNGSVKVAYLFIRSAKTSITASRKRSPCTARSASSAGSAKRNQTTADRNLF